MNKWFFVLILITIPLITMFLTFSIGISVTSSPLGQFNVNPGMIYLNFTNNYSNNVTVAINSDFQNVTIEILNSTTNVAENYSQGNIVQKCKADNPGYFLFVENSTTGQFINTLSPPLNATQSTQFTILDNLDFNHQGCRPGRYWINGLALRNQTLHSETASILVFVDIPISSYNHENLLVNGVGNFTGTLSQYAPTYHSYFFNTTAVANATGVSINLTTIPDADLFLFDSSGNLIAKSVNKTASNEFLIFSNSTLPSAYMEIRVYGNTSNSGGIPYTGYLMYSTMDSVNPSLDFGVMNASSVNQLNITLRDMGGIASPSVNQIRELYYVKRFTGSGTNNFTVFVPDSSIASKIKFNLNWTGASNYSFLVYDQSDNLISNSSGKYVFANVTGAMQEEYNETSAPSSANVWRVLVKDNSTASNTYTLTVRSQVDPFSWLPTSFSSSFSFNPIGQSNSVLPVQINFTTQNNTLDGIYEGNLIYLDAREGGVIVPVKVNITAPTLIVNNTLNSAVFTIYENYGTNLTRTANFILNNTGQYDLSVTFTNSSGVLSCISGCSGTLPISFNNINSITAANYSLLSVATSINSSNSQGLYEGWIFINGTNSNQSLTSHPYPGFNITLRFNLTTSLSGDAGAIRNVQGNFSSPMGPVATADYTKNETETFRFKVFYINHTTEITDLTTSNIAGMWLQEKNVTSSLGRIPSSGNLNFTAGTTPFYDGTVGYSLNFTVPDNKPGGQYEVHTTFNKTIGSTTYTGEAANTSTLIINNVGAFMSSNYSSCTFGSSSCSVTQTISGGSIYTVYVNVANYGGGSSPVLINFTENSGLGCPGYSVSTAGSSGCSSATPSGTGYVLTLSPFSTSCILSWQITNQTTQSASTCASQIVGNDYSSSTSYKWYNPNGISFSISVSNGTTESNPSGSAGTFNQGVTTTTTPSSTAYLDVTSQFNLVNITQGGNGTNTFTVENIHDVEFQDITATIEGINATWVKSITPNSFELAPGENGTVNVVFNAPTDAETKDYLGVFKAKSSLAEKTKSFTLRVLPSEQTKTNITAMFDALKTQFLNVWSEYNKTIASGKNATEAQSFFTQLKSKIDEAQRDITAGDYFAAYQLFGDIKDLMNKTSTALKLKSAGISLDLFTIAIIAAAVVGGGGVLAYLFWPGKTAKLKLPTKGETKKEVRSDRNTVVIPKEETEVSASSWNRLKDKYEKLMKKK